MDAAAGRQLLRAAGVGAAAACGASALEAALSSDALWVKHEDLVLAAVLALAADAAPAPLPPALWACVRFCHLSTGALARVARALPEGAAPLVAQQLVVRSARQSDAGLAAARFGHAALCADAAAAAAAAPRWRTPRRSYAFSVDVHGESWLGRGAGPFFIWVDPADPTGCNDAAALPSRYRRNVAAWGAAHGVQTAVFNGAQCLLAVTEASSHPEFSAALGAEAGAGGGGGDSGGGLLQLYLALARSGGWIHCVDIARLAILWLAGRGSVYLDTDMRLGTHRLPPGLLPLAVAAPSRPPSAAAAAAADAAAPCEPAAAAPPPAARDVDVLCPTPLLVVAQDSDGLLQNNFMAVSTAFHPFLTLLLQAITLSAAREGHVVRATGPAMLTAVFFAFADTRVQPTPSMLLLLCPDVGGGGAGGSDDGAVPAAPAAAAAAAGWSLLQSSAAVAALGACARRRGGAPAAAPPAHGQEGAEEQAAPAALPPVVMVPAAGRDRVREGIVAALPPQLPEASFAYLAHVPRVVELLVGPPPPPPWRHPADDGVADSPRRHHHHRPLEALALRDVVHVCPPSTFYPRHWRDVAGGGADSGGTPTAAAAAAVSAAPLVSRPSELALSADAAEALALRQLALEGEEERQTAAPGCDGVGSGGDSDGSDASLDDACDAPFAASAAQRQVWTPDIRCSPEEMALLARSLRHAHRARWAQQQQQRQRRQQQQQQQQQYGPYYYGGGAGSSYYLSVVATSSNVPGGPGSGVHAAPPSAVGGSAAQQQPLPLGGSSGSMILFGVHAWDCTWGAYPEQLQTQPGGGGGGYADALEALGGLGSSWGGYDSALSANAGSSGGGGGGGPSPLAHCVLPPCGCGWGAACVCGGGSGSSSPTGAVRWGAAAGGYGGALASSPVAATSQQPLAAAVAAGGAAASSSPLLAGDLFGVAKLAARVIRRMRAAGLVVAHDG
jgi:hypothetical protein